MNAGSYLKSFKLPKRHIAVLYVDDHPETLHVFKTLFRRSFTIHTAQNIAEAQQMLQEQLIHVIVCDQRLEDVLTGLDFLEQVQEQYPYITRILLTGEMEMNIAIEAINRGEVFRYLEKPWDEQTMLNTLNLGYEHYVEKHNKDTQLHQYATLFDDASDPIIMLDSNLTILQANNAMQQILGVDKEEIINTSLGDYGKLSISKAKLIKQLTTVDTLKDIEINIKGEEGVRNCLISFTLFEVNNNRLFNAILKDLSKQKEMQRAILNAIINTQEEERERLASDLHDSIGQKISAVKFYINALKSVLPLDDQAVDLFKKSEDTIDSTATELRDICYELKPRSIERYGLIKATEELLDKLSINQVLDISFDYSDELPSLPTNTSIALFRIIQEFINNTLRHAKASQIDILFDQDDDGQNMILKMRDNGIGFDLEKLEDKRGLGLHNVQSRVEALQGQFDIKTALDEGMIFSILIPLKGSN